MRTIEVPLEEWERLLEISKQQMTYRSTFYNKKKWDVVFSTIPRCDGWYFKNYGNTPFDRRIPVAVDGIEFLKELKREFLAVKKAGGRVFLNTKGAYYNTREGKQGEEVQFVIFNIPGIRFTIKPSAMSYRTPQR